MKLVLDTNVVLDWLVFDNPRVEPLRQGLLEKRIAVLTSPAAADEFQRVLAYPQFGLDAGRQREILDLYRSRTIPGAVPEGFSRDALFTPPGFPRCRDASDDHFVALAYHAGADAVVSKDKAVLKLRKRAARFGVTVIDVLQLMEGLESALPP